MRSPGIFLIAVALVLAGCATSRNQGNSVSQLQQIGEKFLAAGDTPGALKYLTEAESKRPDDPVIQYDLGLAYQQRGMTDEAVARFRKALELKPNYSEALNALGAAYAERGLLERAGEAFQKALADPFYQTPYLASYNLARLYEKKGELERALAEYERTLRFQPSYGAAWYRIGQIKEGMQRIDEARNAYGRAISVSPDLVEAHLRYGVITFQAGDLEPAAYSLSRVLKLAPNTTMADEAKLFLDKIRNTSMSGRKKSGSRSAAEAAGVEFITEDNPELHRRTPPKPVPLPPKVLSFPPDSLIITPNSPPPEFAAAPPQDQPPAPVSKPAPQTPDATRVESTAAKTAPAMDAQSEFYSPQPGKRIETYDGPVVLKGQGDNIFVEPKKKSSSPDEKMPSETRGVIAIPQPEAATEEKGREPVPPEAPPAQSPALTSSTGVNPSAQTSGLTSRPEPPAAPEQNPAPPALQQETISIAPNREVRPPLEDSPSAQGETPSQLSVQTSSAAATPSAEPSGLASQPESSAPGTQSSANPRVTTPAGPPADPEIIQNPPAPRQETVAMAPKQETRSQLEDPASSQQVSPTPAASAKPDPDTAEKSLSKNTASDPPPPEQPAPVPEAPQFAYIVQIGPFSEKSQAEEIRGGLISRGYSATVKPAGDKKIGKAYVIQLKPEPSFSKANTLMIQMESEVPGKPEILKVPANGGHGRTKTR